MLNGCISVNQTNTTIYFSNKSKVKVNSCKETLSTTIRSSSWQSSTRMRNSSIKMNEASNTECKQQKFKLRKRKQHKCKLQKM